MINLHEPVQRALTRARMKIVLLIIASVFFAQMVVLTVIEMIDFDLLRSFPLFIILTPLVIIPAITVMLRKPPSPEVRQYFDEHGKLPPGQSPSVLDFAVAGAVLAAIAAGYVFVKAPFPKHHHRIVERKAE